MIKEDNMITIEKLKEDFISGKLEKGIFASTNEKNQTVMLYVGSDRFGIKTFQDNGWIREDNYLYDNGEWVEEELYTK